MSNSKILLGFCFLFNLSFSMIFFFGFSAWVWIKRRLLPCMYERLIFVFLFPFFFFFLFRAISRNIGKLNIVLTYQHWALQSPHFVHFTSISLLSLFAVCWFGTLNGLCCSQTGILDLKWGTFTEILRLVFVKLVFALNKACTEALEDRDRKISIHWVWRVKLHCWANY